MATLTRSSAVARRLRDLRIEVQADDPAVLQAILRELPTPESRRTLRHRTPLDVRKGETLTIAVGDLASEEALSYQPGEWGTDYFLDGCCLHLRAPHGTRFLANAGSGHLTIERTTLNSDLLEGEISAGLSTAIPFLLRKWGYFGVHAAAVRCPSGLLLLPGLSGSGKSTTAGRLAAEGLPLLSDDLVLLTRQSGWALPFGRQPRFRPDALGRFPELGSLSLSHPRLEPIRALLFPQLALSQPTQLQPLSQREALASLMECSLMLGPQGQVREHFRLLSHLARLPSYRLSIGTGASRLASLLHQDHSGFATCLKH